MPSLLRLHPVHLSLSRYVFPFNWSKETLWILLVYLFVHACRMQNVLFRKYLGFFCDSVNVYMPCMCNMCVVLLLGGFFLYFFYRILVGIAHSSLQFALYCEQCHMFRLKICVHKYIFILSHLYAYTHPHFLSPLLRLCVNFEGRVLQPVHSTMLLNCNVISRDALIFCCWNI